MEKHSSILNEIYRSSFNDEIRKLAAPATNLIPKSMKKTRNVIASGLKKYRKSLRKIDVDIIPSNYPKSKTGRKTLKVLEAPGKATRKISKKVYFNPETLPIAAFTAPTLIPGSTEAAVGGYLVLKNAIKKSIRNRKLMKTLQPKYKSLAKLSNLNKR